MAAGTPRRSNSRCLSCLKIPGVSVDGASAASSPAASTSSNPISRGGMPATANAPIVNRSATSASDMASAHSPEYGAGAPGSDTVNSSVVHGAADPGQLGFEDRATPRRPNRGLLLRDDTPPSLDLEPADGFDKSSAPPSTTAPPPAPHRAQCAEPAHRRVQPSHRQPLHRSIPGMNRPGFFGEDGPS